MRLVQSARKNRPSSRSNYDNVFRTDGRVSLPQSTYSPKVETLPLVSPSSSMTDTGSTMTPSSSSGRSHRSSGSTPPLMMGSGSVRDGSSARKKKRDASSASIALAQGFQARRSMSFGGMEEKKTDDGSTASNINAKQLLPQQHRRSDSANNHRRSNSSSPADVMVHGIYAQFV